MKEKTQNAGRGASLAMGVAFVGFTTQFGGGFASGAQIYQYFIHYGFWALLTPFIAQALLSLFYWYGMRYTYRHKTYDYRSFCDSFYGKTRVVFSNLYEIEYFVMVCMAPAVFGLLAVAYQPELLGYSVPMLLLVKTGVGKTVLTPLISVLIILGAVSTGVNMIAGIVERIVHGAEKSMEKRKAQAVTASQHQKFQTVTVLVFTLMTFGIAQFGLIPLVKAGYSYIGYATLIVIVIPFIVHMIVGCVKKQPVMGSEAAEN